MPSYDGLALEKALMEELKDLKKPKTVLKAARKLVTGLNNSVALILHCHTAVLKQAHKLPYALVTPSDSDSAPVRRQRAKLADLIDHYAGKLWDVARSLEAALSATAARALSTVKIFRRALCCVRDITELFRNWCEHFTGKDRTVTNTTEPAVRSLLGLEANSSSSTPLTQPHMDSLLLHITELKQWYHAAVVPAMATCGCELWDTLTTNLRQWTCSEFRAQDPLSIEGSVITVNLPGRRQLPGGTSDLPCFHLTGRNFAAPGTPHHKLVSRALRKSTISLAAPSTPPHKQKAVLTTSSLAAASSPLPATPLAQQQPEEAVAYTPSTAGSYRYRGDAVSSPASPYEAYQPAGKKSRAVVITGCNQLLLAVANITASRGLLDGMPGLQTAAAAFIGAVREADADTALSVGCDLMGIMQAQLLAQATEARLATARQLCEGLPTQVRRLNLQLPQACSLEQQQLQLAVLIGQCSAKYNTEQEAQQLQQQAESTFVGLHAEIQQLRQDLAAAQSSRAQLQHLVKLLHAVDVESAGLLSQLQSALVKPSRPRQDVKAVGERAADQVLTIQSLLASMHCIRLQQQANLITPLLQRDQVLEAMLSELRGPVASCIWIEEASMVCSNLDAAYEAFSSQDAAARAELQALDTSRAKAAYKKQHADSLAGPSFLTVALDAAAAVDKGPLQQAVSLLSSALDAAQARAKLQAGRSTAGTPKSRLPVVLLRLGRVLENTKRALLSVRNKHHQAQQKHADAKQYWARR